MKFLKFRHEGRLKKKYIFETLYKNKRSSDSQNFELKKSIFNVIKHDDLIFEIRKVPKAIITHKKPIKLKNKNFTSNYERPVSYEELKSNLEWKIKNKMPIDPLDMKKIYQKKLLDIHGIYFTPDVSDDDIEKEFKPNLKFEPKIKFVYNVSQKKVFNCSCKRSQCNKNYCACKSHSEKCNKECTCEGCHNCLQIEEVSN